MLALAAEGVAEGTWLRAEQQSAGRGRQTRRWVSPLGNLYASTIVRLRRDDPPAPQLALVAAVAVWEGVEEAFRHVHVFRGGGLPSRFCHLGDLDAAWPTPPWAPAGRVLERGVALKWPNDLLIEGEKVAGMLLERAGDAVVVGIGLNCETVPSHLDQPATSLWRHGVWLSAAEVLQTLVPIFGATLSLWRDQGFEPIRRLWLERAHPVGTRLAVQTADKTRLEGVFDGMSDDGALILRVSSGERRLIYAGDVFHLNPPPGVH